jgi:hypothetical protein
MNKIEKLFNWYLDNQSKLVEDYNGKILVIVDFNVVKSFDDKADAYFFATDNYNEGEFIIQLCTPGDEAYTSTYYSRYAEI